MSNHPNRGWRAKARLLAVLWAGDQRVSLPAWADTDAQIDQLAAAYLAGYEAGRESTRPQRKEPPRG